MGPSLDERIALGDALEAGRHQLAAGQITVGDPPRRRRGQLMGLHSLLPRRSRPGNLHQSGRRGPTGFMTHVQDDLERRGGAQRIPA